MNEKIYNLTIRVKISEQNVTFFQMRWKSNHKIWNWQKYGFSTYCAHYVTVEDPVPWWFVISVLTFLTFTAKKRREGIMMLFSVSFTQVLFFLKKGNSILTYYIEKLFNIYVMQFFKKMLSAICFPSFKAFLCNHLLGHKYFKFN